MFSSRKYIFIFQGTNLNRISKQRANISAKTDHTLNLETASTNREVTQESETKKNDQ